MGKALENYTFLHDLVMFAKVNIDEFVQYFDNEVPESEIHDQLSELHACLETIMGQPIDSWNSWIKVPAMDNLDTILEGKINE